MSQIVDAKDYALAEAARPALGQAGFLLIAVAAMLSTASAINATVYGAARLSYAIARDGELPRSMARKVWNEPLEGLLITSGATVLVAMAGAAFVVEAVFRVMTGRTLHIAVPRNRPSDDHG